MKTTTALLAGFLTAASISSLFAQDLSEREQLHIAVQGICPVSGQQLGTHGTPVKVKIGSETVYLCCKACLQGKVNPQHWATIHANFARAQRICPVMKHELPANPKWIVVDGRIIYVCCPPCTKKIAADPKAFLNQVDEFYRMSLQASDFRR